MLAMLAGDFAFGAAGRRTNWLPIEIAPGQQWSGGRVREPLEHRFLAPRRFCGRVTSPGMYGKGLFPVHDRTRP